MAKKSVKKEEETVVQDKMAERLASYMKKNQKDHLNFEEEINWKSSTGSLLFDIELGQYTPGIVKVHGASFSGKSSSTAEGVKNFLSTIDNSRALWVKAEGRLDEKFRERSGLKFVFKPEEWVDGTCFVMETNVFEFAVDWIVDMVSNNPTKIKYAIVIDSIDALIRRDDLAKSASEAEKVAGPAVILSAMFKKTGLPINKLGHIMFAIHQVRASPKISKFEKGNPNDSVGKGGANSTSHASNFIMEYKPRFKSNNIEEDGKVVGHWCHVNASKGVDEKVSVDIKYPIKHGRKNGSSIWVEYEIAGLLIQWGLVTKGGAWLSLTENLIEELNAIDGVSVEEGFKLQGEANLKGWLEENPEITKYLYNKFLKLLSV